MKVMVAEQHTQDPLSRNTCSHRYTNIDEHFCCDPLSISQSKTTASCFCSVLLDSNLSTQLVFNDYYWNLFLSNNNSKNDTSGGAAFKRCLPPLLVDICILIDSTTTFDLKMAVSPWI